MTPAEISAEWQYRFNERAAILLDGNTRALTDAERAICRADAAAWKRDWLAQENKQPELI